MKIFFSVGEPSGDLHGANLIRELRTRRPDIECVGYGGPRMAASGCSLLTDLTQLAIMWFARVLANLHTFWGLVSRADRFFQHQRPDAVVLIDYPGFNWWIARRAKAHGIPVFYYGVPQLWGWAGWRVKKMRRFVDHVLCKLPFEPKWYKDRGCNAMYVGHPYFDELRSRTLDARFLEAQAAAGGPLVAILPGSRTQEVTSNLGTLFASAKRVRQSVPNVRYAVASFNSRQADLARKMLSTADLQADVYVDKTPELIQAATCCMAVSGSVSLELLYHTKPSVILYRVSRLAYFVQRFFRKIRYITLVNLIASDDPFPGKAESYDPTDPVDASMPMPEYLTWKDKSEQIASHVSEWLTDEDAHRQRVIRLKSVGAEIDQGGASGRAAEYILKELSAQPVPSAIPHADHFAA